MLITYFYTDPGGHNPMKKIIICTLLMLCVQFVFGQKVEKLRKDQTARMTREQRLVHETDRKGKKGKKEVTMQKKIRTEKKQDKKAQRMKVPKNRSRKKS